MLEDFLGADDFGKGEVDVGIPGLNGLGEWNVVILLFAHIPAVDADVFEEDFVFAGEREFDAHAGKGVG